jgi:hypothetical protein
VRNIRTAAASELYRSLASSTPPRKPRFRFFGRQSHPNASREGEHSRNAEENGGIGRKTKKKGLGIGDWGMMRERGVARERHSAFVVRHSSQDVPRSTHISSVLSNA